MSFCSRRLGGSFALATLVAEGLALLGLALAFTTEYWIGSSSASSLAPGIIGAFFLFFAVCTGVVAAIMLVADVVRDRIDTGTVISVVPFLGVAAWGVWYSYTDVSWVRNIPFCWGLLGVITTLGIYVIVRCIRKKRERRG